MASMHAARLTEAGRLTFEEAPAPELGDDPGYVLVRTDLATICGSDVHIVHHGLSAHEPPAPPGYPGHESVGEVIASSEPELSVGQRVLTVPPPTDARCFASHQLLPAGQVLPVPRGMDAERAVLAQQLGTVVFALKRFWPAEGARTVTIVGAGSAGLLFLQEVRRRGAERVVMSDRVAGRRKRAEDLGADVVVDPDERRVSQATFDVTGGQGADLVIEAAGYDAARIDAVDAVRVGGTIGCFGLPERPGVSPFPFETLFRRRASLHLEHATQEEPGLLSFREALERIERQRCDVSGMLTHTVPIERIDEALNMATEWRDGTIKVGVTFA